MNMEEFAKSLDGREMGREIGKELTKEEEQLAKENRWVVVFGHSDDCIELRGFIHDELYRDRNPDKFWFSAQGPMKTWDDVDHDDEEEMEEYFENKYNAIGQLDVHYGSTFDGEYFDWVFDWSWPHEVFRIYEDDNGFCLGVIFKMPEVS